MPRLLILATTLLVAGLAMAADGQGGPPTQSVSNGGFEEQRDGVPVDWHILGTAALTSESHSGGSAIALTRSAGTTEETGLNRAWAPDNGQRGAMLDALSGVITFWYKAVSASPDAVLRFNVIPMSGRPFEDTSASRTYYDVPHYYVGDGEWHQGVVAYNYADRATVVWTQVSPRLTGTSGEWLLDDIAWQPTVGPRLYIERADVLPGRGILRATLKNIGDHPVSGATVEAKAPEGVSLQPVGEQSPLPTLEPAMVVHRHWRITGALPPGTVLTVSASAPGDPALTTFAPLRLEDRLICYSLALERSVLAVGEDTTARLWAQNVGSGDSPPVHLSVALPPCLELVGGSPTDQAVPAGAWAAHQFRVRATSQSQLATLTGTVQRGDKSWPVEGAVTVTAADGPDPAVLQVGDWRLVAPQSEWGWGPLHVETREASGWRPVGCIPHLGRVVYVGNDGIDHEIRFSGGPQPGEYGLRFAMDATDSDGATWHAETSLEPSSDGATVALGYRLSCDRERKVRCWEGPMVLAATRGRDALMPGVEWLEGDEVSSSAAEIAFDLPARLRHVVDPMKVTIPLMSTSDGTRSVGLLWNCRAPWDGVHDRPAPVFSAPGYLEGHGETTMGLMIPPAYGGDWIGENQRLASTPYVLSPGTPLTLDARLWVAVGSKTALDAVDRWVAIWGLVDPAPPPRGDWRHEIEFSARAYIESLYDPSDELWWASKGGGGVMSSKTPGSLEYAWDLHRASLITDDPGRKSQYEEWSAKAAARIGLPPRGADEGFELGGSESFLGELATTAAGAAASQDTEGRWRYDPDRKSGPPFEGFDYWELGGEGDVALGTCAQNAQRLLWFARLTGDSAAYAKGRRALESMETFRVPRAAQVWEVPFHAPDILASAHAVLAYLEGYRYDADPRWLADAVYWGRTGLPFLYLWDDPDRPYLRYSSIAVFGASQYQWSWIGRPVQWNGLDFAGALLELSKYDSAHDWKRVAQGIVVSALYQQATDPENVALWPDSLGARAGDKASWVFPPSLITKRVQILMGRDAQPRTAILGKLPERIHVTTTGEVSDATWEGNAVRFRVAYDPGDRGTVLVANIAAPGAVSVDGQPVPADQTDGPHWRYVGAGAYLWIDIPTGGTHAVEIAGAGFRSVTRLPSLATDIAFDFETDTEGWIPTHAVGDLSTDGGALVIPLTGNDPYLERRVLKVEGERGDMLVLRMRCNGTGEGQIYWGTREQPAAVESRCVHFDPITDGEWHEYRFPIGLSDEWAGKTIALLRLDPCASGPGEARVDSLRLVRTP